MNVGSKLASKLAGALYCVDVEGGTGRFRAMPQHRVLGILEKLMFYSCQQPLFFLVGRN